MRVQVQAPMCYGHSLLFLRCAQRRCHGMTWCRGCCCGCLLLCNRIALIAKVIVQQERSSAHRSCLSGKCLLPMWPVVLWASLFAAFTVHQNVCPFWSSGDWPPTNQQYLFGRLNHPRYPPSPHRTKRRQWPVDSQSANNFKNYFFFVKFCFLLCHRNKKMVVTRK